MREATSISLEAEQTVRKALADVWAAGRDCSKVTDELLGLVGELIPGLPKEEILRIVLHIRSF